MNLSSLAILKQGQHSLLLAEVAALLHDVGKFSNLHIEAHSQGGQQRWANDHAYKAIADNPANRIALQPSVRVPDALKNILNAGKPKAADFLPNSLKNFLATNSVNLMGETYALDELIMLGTPGFATSPQRPNLLTGKTGWLPATLGVCHNEAHVDKQEPARGQGQQQWTKVFISNAFGIETEPLIVDDSPNSLTARLQNLQPNKHFILEAFTHGLGDTRRPINEVLLSDWAWMVASLFKSAVAGAILSNQQPGIRQWKNWQEKIIDHDLHWRLLRVNFDVLGLYAKAVKIADLLAYQNAVNEACQKVKQLVEEEYPLGNEIYRDATGIYFTFPDLDLPAELEQEIRRRVEEVEPELAPRIAVTVGDGQTATEQLKGILAKARRDAVQALAHPFDSQNLNTCWQQQWKTVGKGKWELCPVCRLRPKQAERDTCGHCENRRGKRAEEWAKGTRQNTIWLDEVADIHGRLALIVGQFGLDDWLSGDLVQTMLVKVEPNNPDGCVPKNPSPARLRRIWETTQRFWQTVLEERDAQGNPLIPPLQGRWRITPQNPKPSKVAAYHTYDLLLQGRRLSVLWDGKEFITCDNLDYFEKTADARLQNLLQSGRIYELWTPAGYGERPSKVADVTIGQAQWDSTAYTPAIPILAEPRTFMALVPADKALAMVQAIKAKYEREMGKVRNRLPLTLGVVYADRRTPLAAAIETARRMLERPAATQVWEVHKADCDPSSSGWPSAICLTLKNGERQISISIPAVMGDGTTPDVWYPYWRVETKPIDRTCWFIGPDGEHWVHVTNLREGDCVGFMPSTFDFEYLDTTARRFEVIYDADGWRREATKRQRPYLLEEVDTLEAIWQEVCTHLTTSQIQQLEMLIENRRQAWGEPRSTPQVSQTFRQFVRDALREAGVWSDTLEKAALRPVPGSVPVPGSEAWSDTLEEAALRGMLSDVLEIHLSIHKEKPQSEEA